MIDVREVVDSPEFSAFLIDAKHHGYPSSDVRVTTEFGGATQIVYRDDPFVYVDHFIGGNPFGGHEFVSRVDRRPSGDVDVPIWNMSYYETEFRDVKPNRIREILGTVLRQPQEDLPLRGPNEWQGEIEGLGEVRYTMRPVDRRSNLHKFHAEEIISLAGKRLYVARFIGGLISSHE